MKVRELKTLLANADDDLDVEVMVVDAYQAATRKDPDFSFRGITNASHVFGKFLLS